MIDKKKTGPKTSPQTLTTDDTSAQGVRSMIRLQMPSARITGLRDAGLNITTRHIIKTDQHDRRHRDVALHYLSQLEA